MVPALAPAHTSNKTCPYDQQTLHEAEAAWQLADGEAPPKHIITLPPPRHPNCQVGGGHAFGKTHGACVGRQTDGDDADSGTDGSSNQDDASGAGFDPDLDPFKVSGL